jgi:hypothetical protein
MENLMDEKFGTDKINDFNLTHLYVPLIRAPQSQTRKRQAKRNENGISVGYSL